MLLRFSSCSDLVTSRFSSADYSRFGVTGVRVTGVTRVHNRSLRNRFEATLEEKVRAAVGSCEHGNPFFCSS